MDWLRSLQNQRNHETRDAWGSFESHRRQVTSLLVRALQESASPHLARHDDNGPRVCLLGAGNCNDLDLAVLLNHAGQLDLVDLDTEALRSGVTRQQPTLSDKVGIHGDIDVAGILNHLAAWNSSPSPTSDQEEILLVAASEANLPPKFRESYQVAASLCLLSQLIEGVTLAVGENHTRLLELITAVRLRHLQLLTELVATGGTVILITDIVSSDTAPSLRQTPAHQLPQAVGELIQQRNFFTCLNPFVLRSLFATDPVLASRVSDVRLTSPWLWNLGPRTYAVCAILARRL